MKVIFLDIDGVLNLRNRTRDRFGSFFNKRFVDNLKRIIDFTDAKIVISSSWRMDGLAQMQAMWNKRELPGEVIDVTCSITLQRGMIRPNKQISPQALSEYPGYSIPRGCEIAYWLSQHGKFQRINWCKDEQIKCVEKAIVKNYVILDDDSDMLLEQREHFVKTSNQWDSPELHQDYGLTEEAAAKAITILMTPIEKLYYPY